MEPVGEIGDVGPGRGVGHGHLKSTLIHEPREASQIGTDLATPDLSPQEEAMECRTTWVVEARRCQGRVSSRRVAEQNAYAVFREVCQGPGQRLTADGVKDEIEPTTVERIGVPNYGRDPAAEQCLKLGGVAATSDVDLGS